ncbi:hypothetical protein SAMN00808754_1325 [Thermanaeromonas toyohensis ToBE]|uniref:Uncharacterized protein n=1 Tax=Thermanaeromonas toyohensis ToBE TaxID=698762 RepID=A0A1W1VRT9_9FIRM|nr:hypothetical protein SAMN00808754_1325 [Thermanaeromonas toyohensis ToBE]
MGRARGRPVLLPGEACRISQVELVTRAGRHG